MHAKIIRKKAFWVLGLQETFTEENEDHEGLWKRFMAHHDAIAPLRAADGYYGAYFGTALEGRPPLDCLAGMAVEQTDDVPESLTLRCVPASTFAVFECTVATIHETWGRIFGEWLPESGYEEDDGSANFDWYPPDCKGGSVVLLHLAVRMEGTCGRKGEHDRQA